MSKLIFVIAFIYLCNHCFSQDDCLKKKTGDFCFCNKLEKPLTVAYSLTTDRNTYEAELTLAPGETQCFYQLPSSAYNYFIYHKYSKTHNVAGAMLIKAAERADVEKPTTNTEKIIKEGQFLVETCNKKTIYITKTRKAIVCSEQDVPSIAAVPEPPSRQPENISRGGGDPLKGLNISKAKDMVIGNYYALIVGIDNYKGIWNKLKNAVSDAKAMEALLRSKYKLDYCKTLYNETATRNNIIAEMELLAKNVKENDNVLIYYSGHGEFKKEYDKGYWVPVDAISNSVAAYISNNDLQTFLSGIKSKHTLLISDACFSGDVMRGNTIIIPFESSERYYNTVHQHNSRKAITSGSIEPVMDGGKDGHSVFTYYLLKALDANTDKYFDASQLYEQLKIPVVNNSDQTPQFNAIKNTGDEGGQFIFIKK